MAINLVEDLTMPTKFHLNFSLGCLKPKQVTAIVHESRDWHKDSSKFVDGNAYYWLMNISVTWQVISKHSLVAESQHICA